MFSRMTLTFALAIVAVAVLPASAMAASLVATSVGAEGAAFDGGLTAFATSDFRTSTPGSPLGAFTLEAASVHVEVDWVEWAARSAGATSVGDSHDTHVHDYSKARIDSTDARATSYAFVVPLQGGAAVGIAADDLDVRPSDDGALAHVDRVQAGREPLSADRHGVGSITSSTTFRMTVIGDFVVSIWDIDLVVDSAEGHAEVWTGERSGDIGPVPGTVAMDSVRFQQAYLFVEDGVMEFQVDRPLDSVLYAIPQHLESEGDASLRSATGTLQTQNGPRDVLGEDVRLEGPVSLDLGRPMSQGLPARVVDGDAWIGDEHIAMVQAAAPEPLPLWPWLLAAAAGLAITTWVRPLLALRHARALGVDPPEPAHGIRARRAAGHWLLAYRACNTAAGPPNPALRALGIYHSWRAHRIGDRPIYTMGYAESLRLARRWRRLAHVAPPLVEALADQRERATVALWLHEACSRLGRDDQADAWRQRAVEIDRYRAAAFLGLPQAPHGDVAFT